jgi:hypothetical protein
MLMLLGQVAEPGDGPVLQAIAETRRQADARFVPPDPRERQIAELRAQGVPNPENMVPPARPRDPAEVYGERDRVLEIALFAEANLGDANAFTTYSNDILTGPRELRVSHLRLLPRFRVTKPVLDLSLRLLDDRTGIAEYGAVESSYRRQRRTCDFAIDALGQWFPELAKLTRPPRIYRDQDIVKARTFTEEAIRKLPEGPTTRPKGASAWIELPATRPTTQPTTKPATQ